MASAPANTITPAQPTPAATAATAATAEVVPGAAALLQAARIAIKEDRPIQLDYYADTASGKACMGDDAARKERRLLKSADEFTSLIQRVVKVGDDYLVMTENSIYIVSGNIKKRNISMSQLRMMDE